MADTEGASAWGFPNAATAPGSTRYYSIRFAPAPLRADIAAVFGWRQQIDAVLDEVSDPGVAAAKLEWWRAEIERAHRGEARHPLAQRLAPVIASASLPLEPFLEVIDVRADVLARRFPENDAAWIGSAARDLGAVAELTARCFGQSDALDLEAARRIGTYCALVERLRDAGWLLRRGRLGILPLNQLAIAGLVPESLRTTEGRAALPKLLAQAAEHIAPIAAAIDRAPHPQPVTLRIHRRLRDILLRELEESRFDVLDQRISITPIRKLWHAWRESQGRAS
ncbi:squalene/phytoene synthase family protein [Thiorhodococcus mannitoliphagus]|uniref:Squalene/phytoene synthase family protein n=1 Tax=Thiorhodococcus mannitoliphagus TaxID=329406 RepID=A0A6P1DY58_9GAMM|nr:squalene/phytoene synthase family protein [Thiorhodococcus mannitoliphagus]NEX22410.1 squalene/phytoene synthase family protein [Thiorhodococcus mannitoliphagus]